MVPTMFHRLLALPDDVRARYDVSSLRSSLHGAAPCPVPVKQAMIEWSGPIIWEYYAATEGCGHASSTATTWLRQAGHRRQAATPSHASIVGDDDGNAAADRRGRACVWLKAPHGGRFEYFGDDGQDRRRLPRATTSRSATSATSTRTASCSSPTAAPT